MFPELLFGGFSSLLAGLLVAFFKKHLEHRLRRLFHLPEPAPPSYSERLSELTASLAKSSADVDAVLKEMAQVAKDRSDAVQKLESNLASLESRIRQMQDQYAAVQKTPLAAAEYFAKLNESTERRSARRDFALFGAGVVLTTAVEIIIMLSH